MPRFRNSKALGSDSNTPQRLASFNQKGQEKMTEGIYASSVSSNTQKGGDLGLTHIPRSQDRGVSVGCEEPGQSEQCPPVNRLSQYESVLEARTSEGVVGKSDTSLQANEHGNLDTNVVETTFPQDSAQPPPSKRSSSTDGFPPHEFFEDGPSRAASYPASPKRNLRNSTNVKQLPRNRKLAASSARRNTRSDVQKTRPSFSSFSHRPKESSTPMNPDPCDQRSVQSLAQNNRDASDLQADLGRGSVSNIVQEQEYPLPNFDETLADLGINLDWNFELPPDLADSTAAENTLASISKLPPSASAELEVTKPDEATSSALPDRAPGVQTQSVRLSTSPHVPTSTTNFTNVEWSSFDCDLFGPLIGVGNGDNPQTLPGAASNTVSISSPSEYPTIAQNEVTNATQDHSPANNSAQSVDQSSKWQRTRPVEAQSNSPSVSTKRRRLDTEELSLESVITPYEDDIADLTRQNIELRKELASLKRENRSLRMTLMTGFPPQLEQDKTSPPVDGSATNPIKLEDTIF